MVALCCLNVDVRRQRGEGRGCNRPTRSSVVREQLGSDEHLLWSGQPKGGVRLRPADLFMVPFSLMWGGFAIFWEWGVVTDGAPFFFMLWGVPFVLMGLYLIVGRFFWDAYRRNQTFYGLSNQRVVIVTKGLRAKIKSLQLRTLTDVTLTASQDGTGSIQFGAGPTGAATWFAGSGWPGMQAIAPAFEMIENAKSTYDLVRQAQGKAS